MKVRVQVVVTKEFELNPAAYPDGHTLEQMLQDEIQFADELFHEWIDQENVTFETKGEFVNTNSTN